VEFFLLIDLKIIYFKVMFWYNYISVLLW